MLSHVVQSCSAVLGLAATVAEARLSCTDACNLLLLQLENFPLARQRNVVLEEPSWYQ